MESDTEENYFKKILWSFPAFDKTGEVNYAKKPNPRPH
jgi:hypothetical protein